MSLNPRQLITFAFYDTRAIALYYRVKNIVFESGLYPQGTEAEDLATIADDAASEYGVDKTLLYTLIDVDGKYSISVTGGMGYTKITPTAFIESGYSDPFVSKDNIFAAAKQLAKFKDKDMHDADLIREFLTCGLNFDNVLTFAPSANAVILFHTEKYNDLLRKGNGASKLKIF